MLDLAAGFVLGCVLDFIGRDDGRSFELRRNVDVGRSLGDRRRANLDPRVPLPARRDASAADVVGLSKGDRSIEVWCLGCELGPRRAPERFARSVGATLTPIPDSLRARSRGRRKSTGIPRRAGSGTRTDFGRSRESTARVQSVSDPSVAGTLLPFSASAFPAFAVSTPSAAFALWGSSRSASVKSASA